jgi:hypothetical protein
MTPLSPAFLRPLDATLEGYAWLPRMIDKNRAKRAGTLRGIVHPCPIDRRCLKLLGVSFDTFNAIVERAESDAEVLAALRAHGIAAPGDAWFDAVAMEEGFQRRRAAA